MPRFVTIGYGDEAGYERTPQAVLDAAHAHDGRMVEDGAVAARSGSPVQVRNPEAKGVEVSEGSFLRSDLPIAGFGIIEADSLDHAIELVSQTPCAVAHGVVEVWPLL